MAHYIVTIWLKHCIDSDQDVRLEEYFTTKTAVKSYVKAMKKDVLDAPLEFDRVSVHKEISKEEYRELGITFDDRGVT